MTVELLSLNFLYSVSGIMITVLYIPQLLTVIKAKSSLDEVSLLTWSLWTICLFISTLYALSVTNDLKIALVSFAGSIFCLLISSVTMIKRVKYKRKSNDLPLPSFSRIQ